MIEPKVEPEDKKQQRVKRYDLWKGKRILAKRMGKAKLIKVVVLRQRNARVVSIVHIPELPKKCSELKCLDAVGCRSNALLKCSRGLPVFSPLDSWKPFSRETLPDVDFVFVEVEGPVRSGHLGSLPLHRRPLVRRGGRGVHASEEDHLRRRLQG